MRSRITWRTSRRAAEMQFGLPEAGRQRREAVKFESVKFESVKFESVRFALGPSEKLTAGHAACAAHQL